MSNSLDLLRMLEPAVRPVAAPGSNAAAGNLPFEGQSFEALLAEAQAGAADAASPDAAPAASSNPLSPLAGLDSIDNASLRQLIASRRTEA